MTGWIDAARRRLRWWPGLVRAGHLTDRGLLDAGADAGSDPAPAAARARAHLAHCPSCATRAGALDAARRRLAAEAEAAFDEAMPPLRLVQQRQRILRRIARAAGRSGPARILRFPAAALPVMADARRTRSRFAAAAVLALTATIAWTLDDPVDRRRPAPQSRAPADGPRPAAAPAAAGSSAIIRSAAGPAAAGPDEQFMRELEDALGPPRITPLAALDALTPQLRDAAIDVR